jgi:hypothetical protein
MEGMEEKETKTKTHFIRFDLERGEVEFLLTRLVNQFFINGDRELNANTTHTERRT